MDGVTTVTDSVPPDPTTEAGRRLLSPPCDCGFIPSYDGGHMLDCASRTGAPLDDILAIEAEARASQPQPLALDVYVPTPDDLDDLMAKIAWTGYASEAVEVVEEWTREHWGVVSAFTAKAEAERE